MAVFGHSHLLLLLLASLTVFSSDAYLRKYVPLVVGINERFGPSSIYLVMPFSRERGNDLTLSFAMTREFSRKGISSVVMNPGGTMKHIKKYDIRVRPIVVAVMTDIEDVRIFLSNIDKPRISYPIWLIIFEDEFGASICDLCNKPKENIFHLRFDTEMFVVCCKNKLLQEWWSDHRNRTEMALIGEWSVKDGLTWTTNQSLYERRSDVAGAGFRVGFITNSAYYFEENGGQPAGLFKDILMELGRVINFNVTKILKNKRLGFWEPEKKTWNGVIGLIDRDLIDLGIGEYVCTADPLVTVDFTWPVMVSSVNMYLRDVDSAASYFKVFALETWIVIILLIIGSPLLVALMNIRTSDDSFWDLIVEHCLNVWGIFCQQGLVAFPREAPPKIAYYSLYCAALVVLAAYSATLISFLTVSMSTVPFTSLREFVNDGSYALIILQHHYGRSFLQSINGSSSMKVGTLLKPVHELPRTMDEAFHQVCTQNVAFLAFTDAVGMRMPYFPCKISSIPLTAFARSMFALRSGSEYTGIINNHLLRFKANGVLDRLKKKFMTKPREPPFELLHVTITGVAPLLLVLAGAMGLSLIVILGEKMWARFWQAPRKLQKSKGKTIYPRKPKIPGVIIGKKKRATSHSQLFQRPTGIPNIPAIEFCP